MARLRAILYNRLWNRWIDLRHYLAVKHAECVTNLVLDVLVVEVLGHEPDELVEGDAAVVVLVDDADELLQLALQRRPPERPHDLAQLHRGDGAAPISLQLHIIRCFVYIYIYKMGNLSKNENMSLYSLSVSSEMFSLALRMAASRSRTASSSSSILRNLRRGCCCLCQVSG